MNNKTVGAIASELLQKTPDTLDPIEIQRATEKEYLDNLVWCIDHALKQVDCSDMPDHHGCKDRSAMDGDFYVVALIKKERLLENVLRNYFIPTKACPTPHFDQTVYQYNHTQGEVKLLWVIPDEDLCIEMSANRQHVLPEERELLDFVLKFFDGTLYNLMKKLNGETHFAGSALEKSL